MIIGEGKKAIFPSHFFVMKANPKER